MMYETRFFNARTGEVALTCCTRCGAILWNPQMHERIYHADESNAEASGAETQTSTTEVGANAATDRRVSSPVGRSVAAGTGKPGRR
jgi:hypothetical protein